MAGKGDKRRPKQISDEEFEDKWNKAFMGEKEYREYCLTKMAETAQKNGWYND